VPQSVFCPVPAAVCVPGSLIIAAQIRAVAAERGIVRIRCCSVARAVVVVVHGGFGIAASHGCGVRTPVGGFRVCPPVHHSNVIAGIFRRPVAAFRSVVSSAVTAAIIGIVWI